jgi:hypothetical protein
MNGIGKYKYRDHRTNDKCQPDFDFVGVYRNLGLVIFRLRVLHNIKFPQRYGNTNKKNLSQFSDSIGASHSNMTNQKKHCFNNLHETSS